MIADDHPVYRYGLRALLSAQPDTRCIGEAGTGDQAIDLAQSLHPNVVLMDINMAGTDGIRATRAILEEQPEIGILMLTMHEDRSSVLAAMAAGARGYIVKGAGTEEIVRAIQTVAEGGIVLGPTVASLVLESMRARDPNNPESAHPFPDLTMREREVLGLVSEGLTNETISEMLFLSPKTVRNHISTVFSKLDVHDRSQAIVRARNAGIGDHTRQPDR
jgi:DNA-binding NarL/FixJ family response regulator